MIYSIRVRNYQSHEDSKLEFTEGINAVLGRSQAGKTAILRALLKVLTNRPLGKRFRSHFAEGKTPTIIDVVVTKNGDAVSSDPAKVFDVVSLHIPENGKIKYYLNGDRLKGVGSTVPDEVLQVLKLNPDVNVHKQLDSPFLITATPGEVAATINRITRLEKVAVWTKNINSKMLQASSSVKIISEQLQEAKDNLEKYKNLDKVVELVADLEVIEVDKLALLARQSKLDDLMGKCVGADLRVKRIRTKLKSEYKVAEAERAFQWLKFLKSKIEAVEKAVVLHREIKVLEQAAELEPVLIEAETAYGDAYEKRGRAGQLELLLNDIDDCVKESKYCLEDLTSLTAQYRELLQELGRCPLCNSRITNGVVDTIVGGL